MHQIIDKFQHGARKRTTQSSLLKPNFDVPDLPPFRPIGILHWGLMCGDGKRTPVPGVIVRYKVGEIMRNLKVSTMCIEGNESAL
jgi:hypothetical protein